jgi:flagellin-specific chaperone FliS
MAEVYRNYLIDNGMKITDKDASLSIRIIGGAEMTESFVGIPYETVYPTTTINNAKEIIDDLNSNLDTDFAVQLKGFGDSGVDVGKIAGNLTVNKNIGSMDELKKLYDYSNSINVDLYFDFDIERYNKGSLGISKFFGSATNAGEQKATQYFYDKAVKDKNLESAYNILSPSNFKKVFNKITKKADKYAILISPHPIP